MATNTYTKLKTGSAAFSDMMKAFAITTVMNVNVYEIDSKFEFNKNTPEQIRDHYAAKDSLAYIDTLKVANVTVEGPTKTITGGQYTNPLIKFGKTARLEMQDALGRADAIEAFGGAINEYSDAEYTTVVAMHSTSDFAPARLLIGETFFIDQKTGRQVRVNIIFYQVQPDSILNLNQDSEGDATVFDMNADLLTTDVLLPVMDETTQEISNQAHGVFYSVLPIKAKAE